MTSSSGTASASEANSPPVSQRHFRRGVASVGGGSLISVVALFVEAIIVARALPIEDMGVYVFFQASLALLTIAVDLGFRTTAAQFLSAETDPQQRSDLVNSLLLLRLGVVAVVSAVVLAASPAITRALAMPGAVGPMLYMPVILALSSLDELETGMLQGFHRYKLIAIAQVARSALRLAISAMVLMVLHMGLMALMASWIISLGVSVLVQFAGMPIRRQLKVNWPLAWRALKFGLPVQMTRYLWFGMQRVDTFVLSAITGPVGVAFYDVAGRVPQGVSRLLDAFYAVYHPTLSSRFARQEHSAARRLMRQSLRLFAFATLGLAWAGVLFGRQMIVLLFKERYADAAPTFVVVLLSMSLASTINLMGYALTASGRPGKAFAVNLLRSSVSFGGDFLLIPLMGFIGAAYATLVSQLVAAPLAWWYLRRQQLPAYGRLFAQQLALAAAIYAAFLWLPPLNVMLRVGLLAAFPALALALSLVSADDLTLLLPERFMPRRRPTPVAAAGRPGEVNQ